jgi:hypothetical protein
MGEPTVVPPTAAMDSHPPASPMPAMCLLICPQGIKFFQMVSVLFRRRPRGASVSGGSYGGDGGDDPVRCGGDAYDVLERTSAWCRSFWLSKTSVTCLHLKTIICCHLL